MRTLRLGVGTGVGVSLGPGVAVALEVDDGVAEGVALGDGDSGAAATLITATNNSALTIFISSIVTPVYVREKIIALLAFGQKYKIDIVIYDPLIVQPIESGKMIYRPAGGIFFCCSGLD
jgi:hypothetical protein